VDSYSQSSLNRLQKCFSPLEFDALLEFHKLMQRSEDTLPNYESLSDIAHDPAWKEIIISAQRIYELLSSGTSE